MTHVPMVGNINVFCVGDSTTVGLTNAGVQPPDANKEAYRLALSNALQADIGGPIPNTVSFTWVGPQSTGSAPSNHYSAVGGDTTQLAFIRLLTSCASVVGTQVVVIIYLGLNDAIAPGGAAAFATSYLSVVRRAHNLLRPLKPRFLFGLLNSAWDPGDVDPINAQLPALWAELEREGIEFEVMSWDWLDASAAPHPSQADYDLVGASNVVGQCYHLPFRTLIGYP